MNPSEIPSLAKAVNRWLSYQVLCGREPLLSEAYLGHPVAEYLNHKHSGQLEAEVNHPILKTKGRGRPYQIDYVLRTRDSKAIEVAIECKWISETQYDRQRIVNDLLRLECVRIDERHVRRYLLVAGRKEHFEKNFRALRIISDDGKIKLMEEILSFSSKDRKSRVAVLNCRGSFREFFEEFASSFSAEIPRSFETVRLARRVNDEISVYLWEIRSVKGRRTFDPKKEW